MSRFVISDVHGCMMTLKALIEKLPPEANSTNIVFVGDLIDRGSDSREVINFVRDGGYDVVKGNHEVLMIDAWDNFNNDKSLFEGYNDWTMNGGSTTLNNYRDKETDKIDYKAIENDIEWMRKLPSLLTYKDSLYGKNLLITHSTSVQFIDDYFNLTCETCNRDMSLENKSRISNMERLMIWNRNIPKIGSEKFFNISGHNIIDNFIFNNMNELKIPKECLTKDNILVDKNLGYACIDTGAFTKYDSYGNDNCSEGPELDGNLYRGRMTCIIFPSLEVIQQCNIEEFDYER